MYTDNDFLCDLNEASFNLAIEEFEFNHSQKNTYIAESTSIAMEGTLGNIWGKIKNFLKSIWEFIKKAWNKFIDWIQGKEKEQEEKEKKEKKEEKDNNQTSTRVVDSSTGDEDKDEELYNRYKAKRNPKFIEYQKSSKPENMFISGDILKQRGFINLDFVEIHLTNYKGLLLNIRVVFLRILDLLDTYDYKSKLTGHEDEINDAFDTLDKIFRITDRNGIWINDPTESLIKISEDPRFNLSFRDATDLIAFSLNESTALLGLTGKVTDNLGELKNILPNEIKPNNKIFKSYLDSLAEEREKRKKIMKYIRKFKTNFIPKLEKDFKLIEEHFKNNGEVYNKWSETIAANILSLISFIYKSSNNVIKAIAMILSDNIQLEKYFSSDIDFLHQ